MLWCFTQPSTIGSEDQQTTATARMVPTDTALSLACKSRLCGPTDIKGCRQDQGEVCARQWGAWGKWEGLGTERGMLAPLGAVYTNVFPLQLVHRQRLDGYNLCPFLHACYTSVTSSKTDKGENAI